MKKIALKKFLSGLFTLILLSLSAFSGVGFANDDLSAQQRLASNFTVAPCFGDNMVLQQNEPIRIWGTSTDEGATVMAVLGDSTGKSIIKNGMWEIVLAPRAYSPEPLVLEIIGNENCRYISFENITIGNVWVFIGQSNIAYTMASTKDFENFSKTITNEENIKLFDVPLEGFEPDIRWRQFNKYSTYGYSALATYFSKQACEYTNNEVPFGIISLGFSGKDISAFLKEDDMSKDIVKTGEIYDSVLKYIEKLPVAGFVWYQEEADASEYEAYPRKLKRFIQYTREVKNQENYDIPFYIIELPPCFDNPVDPDRQYINFGEIRGVTASIVSDINNVYICPTSDLWSNEEFSNNLHPNNKHLIAQRLTLMIMDREYQFNNPDQSFAPVAKKVYYGKNEMEVIIEFDYGNGITALDNEIKGLRLIDENWNLIDNFSVEFTSENTLRIRAEEPVCIIRYGTKTNDVFVKTTNLCGKNNMPCAAFSFTLRKPHTGSPASLGSKFSKFKILVIAGLIIILLSICFYTVKMKFIGRK